MLLLALALCSFSGSNVYTIPTPVSYQDPSQGTWQQSVQVLPGRGGKTAVFIIPGGPGATTITPNLPSQFIGIPTAWSVVLTDPRGAGCNIGPPASTFSTDTLARDILTIITTTGVTDYILFGASYGTVEATVLEKLIEADPTIPKPRAVVLEGCIGHAWNGYQDYFQGFVTEWDRTKLSILQSATVALFAGPPYPLGLSSQEWALLITSQLTVGDTPGLGNALHLLLEPIDETSIRQRLASYESAANQVHDLVLAIYCSELTGDVKAGDLVSNELVLTGSNLCTGGLTNRYDSFTAKTSVPIYIFQGQYDPIVRMPQSTYHFLAHAGSQGSYAVIGNAGHEPLLRSLLTQNCVTPIWRAIASASSLGPLLDACGLPYALLERGANQPAFP